MRAEVPPKRLTGTHIAALLLATLIYLFHVALLWAGGWLIWSLSFGRIFAGALLIYFSIRALIIRYDELPPDMLLIDDKQFPALINFVREVASRLDVPMPQIVLSEQFTATFARVGPKRQSLLCIGIPFLALLNGGELTSLIGHELSHAHDGARTRSLYVQNARTALESWHALLSFRGLAQHSNMAASIVGVCLFALCFPLRVILIGSLRLFELLVVRDSQRAEYIADLQSLAVAGNRDAPQLLQKSCYRYLGALHEAYANAPLHQKYSAIQQRFADIPQREKERVWRIAKLQQPKLSSSHPTVSERIALLKNRRDIPPAYVIDAQQFATIQAELQRCPQILHGHEIVYLHEANETFVMEGVELSAVSAD